ncbi:acyltransferase family protein [Roseibium aggregatum]|uniref:acyltransferase family protein n=1 Tax=Roseibium aggregatum TaxID=187304 RepID=UPI003A9843F8
MHYRAEIDGLRAIAVVSVVLFHAGFSWIRGGYVGVDVFFVISGFLITFLSLERHSQKKFNIVDFFERRARRILPALFCVCIATTIASLFILDPLQITRFFESLTATFLFISNFFFLSKSGYFDTAAEFKPLLHTWSLGTEEQYYILFPFALLFLTKLPKKISLIILVSAFALSISSAQILIELKYKDEAFYLLPFRIWQMLIGASCAVLIRYNKLAFASCMLRNTASAIGLALILVAVLTFNNNTPSPGAHALIPTIGAALVILFAGDDNLSGRLLRSRYCVFVGLMSYSLYLWHQPVLALARVNTDGELSVSTIILLLLALLPLSYLTWRFIESPFRSKNKIPKHVFVPASSAMTAVFIIIGVAGTATNGFLQHVYPQSLANTYAMILDAVDYDFDKSMQDNNDCIFWSESITSQFIDRFKACEVKYGKALVVLGDSHGKNLYNIVAQTKLRKFVVGLVQGGCRPHDKIKSCQYETFKNFARSNNNKIDLIIFHQSGSHLISNLKEIEVSHLSKNVRIQISKEKIKYNFSYLNNLFKETEINTLWVGPFTEFRKDPMKSIIQNEKPVLETYTRQVTNDIDRFISSISIPSGIDYLSFNELFQLPDPIIKNGCFFFRDKDHLSRCAESYFASEIIGKPHLFSKSRLPF